MISVTSATLLRDGPWDGVQLVAHELAHNLTWQGGNTGEITGNRYWDFFAMDSSTGGAAEFRNTYAGVLAGDYSDVLWYEVSADIIASWVLDDWRGEPNLSIVDQFIRCSVLYTCSVPHE